MGSDAHVVTLWLGLLTLILIVARHQPDQLVPSVDHGIQPHPEEVVVAEFQDLRRLGGPRVVALTSHGITIRTAPEDSSRGAARNRKVLPRNHTKPGEFEYAPGQKSPRNS